MFHDTYITSVSMGLINQLKHQLRGPQRRGQISLCEPSVCGDGVLDNGEDCDDGNNVSSDWMQRLQRGAGLLLHHGDLKKDG